MNLASLVDRHAPGGRAVYDAKGWLTWGEVRARARAVSAALSDAGISAGDRVALVWPNSADFVIAYLGVLATGAVAVPLNPMSPAAELRGELGVVEPAAMIGSVALSHDEAGGARVVVVDDGPGSDWRRWSTPEVDGDLSDGIGAVERSAGDLAVLLFTSGTAGPPKAAMLTHGNLAANLEQMQALPGELLRADDVGLAIVPMCHVFGLNVVLGLTLAVGAAILPMERFEIDAAVAAIAEHGVTVLVGAPPMYSALARAGGASPVLEGVRLAVSGAAALPDGVSVRFAERHGLRLDQGYGLTEASPVVSTTVGDDSDGRGRRTPSTRVGQVLPGVSVRLVDESGDDVLAGDPGEIWVQGDNVFAGYWRDEEATRLVLTEDGWLKTGDVGILDADGALHVVERSKDVIIVSGFNVFPAEVERVVATVEGVAEVVVIGRPDPETGEAVEAVVVAAAGTPPSEGAIRSRCRSQLAGYKCPATVRFVDELPHGLGGKALRRALRDQVAR